MSRKILSIYLCISFVAVTFSAFADDKPLLIPDGRELTGVDGSVQRFPKTNAWFYTFDSVFKAVDVNIPAKTKLQLLPSSTLQKLIETKKADQNNIRLWGKIASFQNKNYIFPSYFLYLMPSDSNDPAQPSQETKITINDPNDSTYALPQEIIEKIKNTKAISPFKLQKPLDIKEDSMIINRIGYIEKHNNSYIFTLDALGRNTSKIQFKLLPSKTLELALTRQGKKLNKSRFKISGLITRFNNTYYLLLHRVVPSYSYGNFTN